MRVLVFIVALAATGIDIPDEGIVTGKTRIGEVRIERIPQDCGYWDCAPEVVGRTLPVYQVTYARTVFGVTHEKTCQATPRAFWQAREGETFRCAA